METEIKNKKMTNDDDSWSIVINKRKRKIILESIQSNKKTKYDKPIYIEKVYTPMEVDIDNYYNSIDYII